MTTRPIVLVEILRPHNMLASALAAVAGFVVAGGRAAGPVWMIALLAAVTTGAGNVVNDCFDLPIDRVNKPRRPLPSGRITMRAAVALYAAAACAVLALAILVVPRSVAVLVVGWQVALFVYARWCKRWLVIGNLLVAAVSSSAFFAGAMAAGNAAAAIVPAAIAFAFVVCREIVKGGEDLEGDRACGVRTIAVWAGRARAGRTAAVLMLALAALIPVPTLTLHYRVGYFVLMEGVVVPALLFGATRVADATDRSVFSRTSRTLKLAMFVGIAAIAAGA